MGRSMSRIEDLYRRNKSRDERVEMLRIISELKEVQDCTFQPQLLGSSIQHGRAVTQNAHESEISHNVEERLMEWGKLRSQTREKLHEYHLHVKQQQELDQCTFTPATLGNTPKP